MKITVLIIILHFFFFSGCLAQDCNCGEALIKDKIIYSSNIVETISYYENLTETEYEQLKTDSKDGFSAGVSIASVITAMISSSSSKDDFEQKLNTYKQAIYQKYGYSMNVTVNETRTNPIAYKYWSLCMEHCIDKNDIGINAYPSDEEPEYVAMMIRYTPAPGKSRSISYTATVTTGGDSIYHFHGTLLANGNDVLLCKRKYVDNHSDLTFIIKGHGYASTKTSSFSINQNQVDYVNISYNVTKTLPKVGDLVISDNNDGARPDWGHDYRAMINKLNANYRTPSPLNPTALLPFPVTCDQQWKVTMTPVILYADAGYKLVSTPTMSNIRWDSGAIDWNKAAINNGKCDDGRPTFIVAINNDLEKAIYLALGSGPTGVRLIMDEVGNFPMTENLVVDQSNNNSTFVLQKSKLNELIITVVLRNNNQPLKLTFDQLGQYSTITDSGDNYIVSFNKNNKNALFTKQINLAE